MGKIFAQVINVTPLEVRTKKDGSGTYEYSDVTMQICDYEAKPSLHETFDWKTGVSRGKVADVIKYDAVRDNAKALADLNLQVGEWAVATISAYVNKFGDNVIDVHAVERYQAQQQQQPVQQQTRNVYPSGLPGIR